VAFSVKAWLDKFGSGGDFDQPTDTGDVPDTPADAAGMRDLETRLSDYTDTVGATKQPLDSDLTAIAALTTTTFGRALLSLADAAAGRTALGLGTAATQASGAFDASGAAAAAQAASQPLDSDLTAIAALATTSYGRAFLALADAAAARAAIGSGTPSSGKYLDGGGAWTLLPAQSGSGLPANIVSRTSSYTAAAGDLVLCNATSSGFAVTLPTGASVGALVTVVKTDSSANVVTVAGTINGDAGGAALGAKDYGAVFEYIGSSSWRIVSITNDTSGTFVSNDGAPLDTLDLTDDAATIKTALGLGTAASTALDTDTTLAANSNVRVPSQEAVKAYVDGNSASVPTVTKTATLVLTGGGAQGELAAFTSYAMAFPIDLPAGCVSTEWEWCQRNRDSVGGAAQTGVINVTAGVTVGQRAFSGVGAWMGQTVATPLQAVAPFATASDGAEYVSGTVTNPAHQFGAGLNNCVQTGGTLSGSTPCVRSNVGCVLSYTVDGTSVAAQAQSSAAMSGSTTTATGLFDCRVRIHFVTESGAKGIKVVWFLNDSIGERVVGSGSQAQCNESWPVAAGLRNGFVAVNLGVGGVLTHAFSDGGWLLDRADGDTVDAVEIGTGYNDYDNGHDLATFQTDVLAVMDSVRTDYGVDKIALASTIPGSLSDAEDTERRLGNAWLAEMPYGARWFIDFEPVIRDVTDTSSPYTSRTDLVPTPPHPNKRAYVGAMAACVPPNIGG
jgi:hypothetical protein